MDYYLKAADETALYTLLASVGVVELIEVKDVQGNVQETRYVTKPGYDLDVIGTVYKPTGNLVVRQSENFSVEVPEMAPVPGFHANLRGPGTLAPKVELVYYQPTHAELADPAFVMPQPTQNITPSPIESILVDPSPSTPARVWL